MTTESDYSKTVALDPVDAAQFATDVAAGLVPLGTFVYFKGFASGGLKIVELNASGVPAVADAGVMDSIQLAGEDLSGARGAFVKFDAATQKVIKCTTDGEFTIGAIQNTPLAALNSPVLVRGFGKAIVKIGSVDMTAGMFFAVDTNGLAKEAEPLAVSGADADGSLAMGKMMEDGTAGTLKNAWLNGPFVVPSNLI